MENQEKITLAALVDRETDRSVRIAAAQLGMNKSQWVREVIGIALARPEIFSMLSGDGRKCAGVRP